MQMSGSAATFQQMMMSQRFGFGDAFKPGSQGGSGGGLAGYSASEMGLNPNMGMIGGQGDLGENPQGGDGRDPRRGDGQNLAGDEGSDESEADSLTGVTTVIQPSGPVDQQNLGEQYRNLVDEYFKALTTTPSPGTAPREQPETKPES